MAYWTLKTLQEEQKPWVLKNFGERPAWQPLLGIAEEMGELFQAFWIVDDAYAHEVKDALADIMIYMADFCTAMNFDLQKLYDDALRDDDFELAPMAVYYGDLAHAFLKDAQRIRGTHSEHVAKMGDALDGILRHLIRAASNRNWDLRELTKETWETVVKKRDWTLHRETGVAP